MDKGGNNLDSSSFMDFFLNFIPLLGFAKFTNVLLRS